MLDREHTKHNTKNLLYPSILSAAATSSCPWCHFHSLLLELSSQLPYKVVINIIVFPIVLPKGGLLCCCHWLDFKICECENLNHGLLCR